MWRNAVFFLCFFSCISATGQTDQKSLPDPLDAGWNGEKVCELLYENDINRVLRCTFAPGIGHEKHRHAPHYGYTITGSTFRIEDENGIREVEVPDGSFFSNEKPTVHEVQNIGQKTAVFLIFEIK